MSNNENQLISEHENNDSRNDEENRLVAEVAESLSKRLTKDFFFMSEYLEAVEKVSKDENDGISGVKLIRMMIDGFEPQVRRIVGTDSEKIATFASRVLEHVDSDGNTAKK